MDANSFIDFRFADAFETWELQRGYPVIHVKYNRDGKQFHITQKRYLNSDSNNIDTGSWFIPMNFAHANNPNFDDTTMTHFFENGTIEKLLPIEDIEGFDDDEWFLFNKQQLGYYRFNYESENWHRIIEVLNSANYQQIHVLNRAQLIDDVLSFAIDGFVEFDIAFGVLMFLERETDYLPWAAAAHYLDQLDYLLVGSAVRSQFHLFVNRLVSRMYAMFHMEQRDGEVFSSKQSRELAINWSCRTGNERCLRDSHEQIRLAMTGQLIIPKPLEITLLCNAVKGGRKIVEFDYFYNKIKFSIDQAERLRIIDGLACSSHVDLIKTFLETSTDTNSDVNYRLHERVRIFNSVLSSSSNGILQALDFLSKYFDDIRDM